jgi:formate-dependent nitrite reductase membrane component NrfD
MNDVAAQNDEKGYYGLPLLKTAGWKPSIPVYFFVGGAAGAAAVVAAAAELMGGEPRLARDARRIAAAGGLLSPALLIDDLGVPSRFLNMLRVFKPQSPMSVGAWTLVGFSTTAAVAALADFVEPHLPRSVPVRGLRAAAQAVGLPFALLMPAYTGVLIGATAIPVWNENLDTLPAHFSASGLASAVALLELLGHRSRALTILGGLAAIAECLEGALIETRKERALDPLRHGGSGSTVRAGTLLSGPLPLVLRRVASGSSSVASGSLRIAASLASLTGSLLTRFGWIRAGRASVRDTKAALDAPRSRTSRRLTTVSDRPRLPQSPRGNS